MLQIENMVPNRNKCEKTHPKQVQLGRSIACTPKPVYMSKLLMNVNPKRVTYHKTFIP